MIDRQLMDQIRSYVQSHSSLAELPGGASQEFVARVRERFKRSDDAIWWWEDLHDPAENIRYYGADAGALIIPRFGAETPASLVITDDERSPWPVITGTVGTLVELVYEHRYFEYMLAANDASWVVFDTHHNALILVGDIPPVVVPG